MSIKIKCGLTQRALDGGDCRFAACATLHVKYFSLDWSTRTGGFEFILLPIIVHVRPAASIPYGDDVANR